MESKDRDKYEVVGYSKTNTVNAKDKNKQDSKKNYLGPKKEQNKFKNLAYQKALIEVVICVEITYIMLNIARTRSPRVRKMMSKSMIT